MLRYKYIQIAGLWLLCLSLCTAVVAQESMEAKIQQLYSEMPQLDDDFQVLSNDFYVSFLKQTKPAAWQDLAAVPNADENITNAQWVDHIAGIKQNLDFVCQQYLSAKFTLIIEVLYKYNETATLKDLTDCIKTHNDPVARSENYFELAKYYYVRQQWQGVIAALTNVNRKDLSITDAQYADLLQGYALQEQKKHRQAVKIYQLIPPSSPYYAYAKLNEGIGYLRQGWWTEAHREFETAIQSITTEQNDEFKNRLFVVLGYSQLDYEFYRDARNSLRNVAIDSTYTNKALMGLGLAAAYQEDFSGALNAFQYLLKKPKPDLSVDEAYLLVPSTYEELGDYDGAALAYNSAITYYKNRVNELNQARLDLNRRVDVSAPVLLSSLDARADELYGAKHLIPAYIVINYQTLLAFKTKTQSAKLRQKIQQLEARYDQVLKALVQTNIELRETILNSYLSQAQYGVAKLYDTH